MRILLLIPGTGHFFCGSCLRDNALGKALRGLGHDAMMAPLYLPFFLEEPAPDEPVHMGGINMYLRQKAPFTRNTPKPLADLLDNPALLRWASRQGNMTDASGLGPMTLSMLRGDEGRQADELEKLIDWIGSIETPDVVILSNVMLVGMARRLKQALCRPILCTMQGEQPFLDALPEPYRSDAWRTIAERAADVDAFLPVSRHYGEVVRERIGVSADRVHPVLNGIDLEGFAPGEPPERPTVGYLARMCADKGLPTLVEAFVTLKKRGSVEGLRLRVGGVVLREDEKLVAAQKERLHAAGVLGDVEFLPNLERDAKIELLRSLSVFSVPAIYGESFGLYVLEALACGVPVVEPRHGAFPELLEETGGGVLCEPGDADSLADALEGLLLDPDERSRLAQAGCEAVAERFTSERMARDVAAVCESLTG